MDRKVIQVLVVEDSAVTRQFICGLMQSDPALRVIGAVASGEDALAFLQGRKPDVITMDINLPHMDGFDTTRRIMETTPVPVVIVTATTNPKEVATTFRAVEAGALAVLPIPAGIGHPDHANTAAQLLRTVKSMAEIRVVRRWARTSTVRAARALPMVDRRPANGIRIVAIGASTGGPVVLKTILSAMPRDFPVPIAIVQHIAAGFVEGFVQWLNTSSSLPVHVAGQRVQMKPGHAYVAPDDYQMLISADYMIILRKDPPENGLRPAVSSLFRSVAEVYGRSGAGVLLTGMGRDGAEELRQIKDAGGLTIAQSEESCVISGMPGEAIRRGAALHILPPEKVAPLLTGLVRNHVEDKYH